MNANYSGQCAICDGPVIPGQLIVRRKGAYVHGACASGESS